MRIALPVLVALCLSAVSEARAADGAPCAPPAPAPVVSPCDPCKPWWCEPPPPGCCPTTCLPDVLVRVPCVDGCLDKWREFKETSCFTLGAGAYHWWNLQNRGDHEFTYGYPNGGEGTYFYYVNMDLACPTQGCTVTEVGGHFQLRARDQTVFRSFFEEQVWFYEGYGYAKTRFGAFKAGKVWKRFGLDWDGTFWGNVAYYDGMKLDPDWGASWEHVWNPEGRLSVDSFLQFFFAEDRVNGSLAGGDAESTPDVDERNTLVARVVPTWHFTDEASLALGLSGYVGNLKNRVGGESDTGSGWAVDLTFTWCDLKAFAEIAQANGIQNPSHYVTGGPSDRYLDLLLGVQYRLGPVTARIVYSHGEYDDPGGKQDLLLVGGVVALTKWLDLYVEYVDWTVQPDGGAEVVFEDGFQLVLNWNV